MKLAKTEADGRMIASGRMLAGLDQAELARRADVAAATISNIERGNGNPRPATVAAVLKAIRAAGVSIHRDAVNRNIVISASYK